jgi:hypothetical protein
MAGRRCAEWRFPTAKQQKAEETTRRLAENQSKRAGVDDEDAWWPAVLNDPRASAPAKPLASKALREIGQQTLRAECLRCFRVVSIGIEEARSRP